MMVDEETSVAGWRVWIYELRSKQNVPGFSSCVLMVLCMGVVEHVLCV